MKGKKMIGILAVIMAAMTVTTFVVPAIAVPAMAQLRTRDQDKIQDPLLTQDRLQTQDQLCTCVQNCSKLQTRNQIRAMDGSCGAVGRTGTGVGVQTWQMTASQLCISDSQLKTQTRNQIKSCV